jgi:hypothetical protein
MPENRRLWKAKNEDIRIVESLSATEYVVSGSRDINYLVDINEPYCDCPDWEKRSPDGGCKHILKVKLHEENQNKTSREDRESNSQEKGQNSESRVEVDLDETVESNNKNQSSLIAKFITIFGAIIVLSIFIYGLYLINPINF